MLRSLIKNAVGRLFGAGAGDAGQPSPDVAAWLRQAEIRSAAGESDRAQQCLMHALALDPANVRVLYALGVACGRGGDYAAAARHLGRLLELKPDHAGGCNALGNIHRLRHEWEAAITCYRRAVDLDPRFASALSNLGACLKNEGRPQQALEYLERAVTLDPGNAELLLNLGAGLIDAGREEEGERHLRRALELQPQMAEAHLALALRLLGAGRFGEGWHEYEWRCMAETGERRSEYPCPRWQGEALAGRTIVVRAEQGLGDQIMFASCLPELITRAGRCIVECDPRLKSVFARSFPQATVYMQRPKSGAAWIGDGTTPDFQIGSGSLPHRLHHGREDFPAHHCYLRADPGKTEMWRARLAALGSGIKVGISWRGGTRHTRQFARSVALRELLPLLNCGHAHFVSLQYGDCREEIAALAGEHGVTLHHWPDVIADYDETAALTAALDLVVSVQTAVVHLAGALGRPVWVMVPAVPEWRYLRDGETMPWYPSARLFRQHIAGDWKPLIARVAGELFTMNSER